MIHVERFPLKANSPGMADGMVLPVTGAGRYIALEGAEACGKSTHAKRLAADLGAVLTRETGGTRIGGMIRDILHDAANVELDDAYRGFAFARGLVHAVAAERMAGRFADVRAYVAGPPPMVDASLRLLLREARLPPADIRYDKFS